MSGRYYADLVEAGRARPYELGSVRYALREVLTHKAVELLEHVYAMQRGFGGNRGGAILDHATAARLLVCSERTAGAVMRELVELALVEQRPDFVVLVDDDEDLAGRCRSRGAKKHRERTPAYRTTAACDAAIARVAARRSSQGGKKFQPAEIQLPLQGSRKGVRGRGRPERRWVASVRDARAREATSARDAIAKVWLRLPDGRKQFANESPPDVGGMLGMEGGAGCPMALRLGLDDDIAGVIAELKARL